jgi:hypothetical protein
MTTMFNKKTIGLSEVASWIVEEVYMALKSEDYIVGLGVTSVPPDGSAVVRVQATKSFKPYRLIIPAHVAPCLVVNNMRVEKDGHLFDQFISAGVIPGEAFVTSVQTHLRMTPVLKGDWISLCITNLFNSELAFTAAVIGTATR